MTAEHVARELDALTSRGVVPGLQYVAVGAEGAVIEHASGRADLRTRTPLVASTTLMAYSMSKVITAVAVLQLVERRQLDLDASVSAYVTESPYGHEVTVRQLLAHTGGVPNPVPLKWVHAAASHDGFDERAALAAVLRRHPRLKSAPGSRYRYSNVGYWLLGRVVEQASATPFARYVTEQVLTPLGVGPADLGYRVADDTRHATGYLETYSVFNFIKGWFVDPALIGDYCGRWLEIRPHYANGAAFGGLVGRAAGFGRLLRDQLRPRSMVLGSTGRALLYEPQRTQRGAPLPMTLGWHVGACAGVPHFYKEGGGGGFRCMLRLYPTQGVGTVIMTNATGVAVARVLDRVDPLVWPLPRS